MRVLDTFMTILLLGILSSTIADEEVTGVNDISNSSAALAEELETGDCQGKDGLSALAVLLESWVDFLNCTEGLVDFDEAEADKLAALADGKWDKFAKKYCNKLPSLEQCVNGLVNTTKSCLDEEDREVIDTYHNISKSFLEFVCQKDGARVASFLNTGGLQCVNSTRETIQQNCKLEPLVADSDESDESTISWIELAQKDCSVIESFGNCTVAVMQTCENSTPADVMGSLFDFLKSEKSCPTAQPSTAT